MGLATPSHKKFRATEAETSTITNQSVRSDHRERQRMTPRPPMKLFSPKACVKIEQWNVRTMRDIGKCAQVVSEMRWNGCGKMTAAPGETILYSGKSDEVGHHEQGVGLTFTRRENNSLMEGSPF